MAKKDANATVFGGSLKTVDYRFRLTGQSPLILHADNIEFSEIIEKWRKDAQNKKVSKAGDDRSPAWSWIGCFYSDKHGDIVTMPADNIKTMLREAGGKVPTGKGKATYKLIASYGVETTQFHYPLLINGKEMKKDWLNALVGETDFSKHQQAALDHGFELFIKRAKIGVGPRASKHVRVRPLIKNWSVEGGLRVIDESESGITEDVLRRILQIGGAQIGLCDWRPSCSSAGSYGRFSAELERA